MDPGPQASEGRQDAQPRPEPAPGPTGCSHRPGPAPRALSPPWPVAEPLQRPRLPKRSPTPAQPVGRRPVPATGHSPGSLSSPGGPWCYGLQGPAPVIVTGRQTVVYTTTATTVTLLIATTSHRGPALRSTHRLRPPGTAARQLAPVRPAPWRAGRPRAGDLCPGGAQGPLGQNDDTEITSRWGRAAPGVTEGSEEPRGAETRRHRPATGAQVEGPGQQGALTTHLERAGA